MAQSHVTPPDFRCEGVGRASLGTAGPAGDASAVDGATRPSRVESSL